MNILLIVMIIAIILTYSMILYFLYMRIITNDPSSIDTKNYNKAKNDCKLLKQYLLDHYEDYRYDEAKARYGLMCK